MSCIIVQGPVSYPDRVTPLTPIEVEGAMRRVLLAITILAAAGCGNSGRGGARGAGDNGSGGGGSGPNPQPAGPDDDFDHDGYTPNTGDCNDSLPGVNPDAVELPGNQIDDDCDGVTDESDPSCDPAVGSKSATELAQSLEQCDPRFFKSAVFNGPSDPRGRAVVADFGVFKPLAGSNMILVSSGVAADKDDPGYVVPQSGTDFGNQFANPLPNLKGAPMCGQGAAPMAQDYTELVLSLKAPSNVTSYSFNFQFFSAEYPEYVCTQFNDKFLVLQESPNEFQSPTNIAFDMQMNPITINNGFFSICTNDTSKPQTQHCTKPVTDLAGTGYEDTDGPSIPLPFPIPGADQPIGGSTGWLTTTAPVSPNETVTLHFIIFDEGDGILDSAALIDNFRWGTQQLEAPTTIQ